MAPLAGRPDPDPETGHPGVAALLAAPAGANDDEWPKLSERDKAIVECMVEGKPKCEDKTQHETDPKLWPTEQGWVWSTETKLYSWPALSGPSAADVFRYYARQESPGTFSQSTGSTPP